MFPRMAMHDSVNGSRRHAVFCGEALHAVRIMRCSVSVRRGDISTRVAPPDLPYLIGRQRRLVMLRAVFEQSTLNGVTDVVMVAAPQQVGRITARRIVAGVPHAIAGLQWPIQQGEQQGVGVVGPPLVADCAVAFLHTASRPRPTGIRAGSAVDLRPQVVKDRLIPSTPDGRLGLHREPPTLGVTLPAVQAAREPFAVNYTRSEFPN